MYSFKSCQADEYSVNKQGWREMFGRERGWELSNKISIIFKHFILSSATNRRT